MKWIEAFKIALIEQDEEKLSELTLQCSSFDKIDEMIEAQHLIAQAIDLFVERKKIVSKQIREIELSRKFLTSTQEQSENNLDITS